MIRSFPYFYLTLNGRNVQEYRERGRGDGTDEKGVKGKEKMKKKILSMLLCTVITAGMLAGCGSSTSDTSGSSVQTEASQEAADSAAQTETASESDAQTEASAETSETDGEKIVVTIGDFPNKEADPALWEVYQGYVEKFKEIRPDVEIIQDEKSYSVDSFATTAATGQLANLFRVAFTEPQACIDSGYVRDVTDIFVERGYADGLNDDVMEMLTADGKYYGIPMTGYSMGMWYNVNLFKQAGLVNEDGTLQYPTTWDEVIETAQIIKEKTGQAGFGFQGMGNQAGWVMQNLDWAYGAELMVEEEDGSYKATFATPELEEAFQIYYDMKWKYDVLPANTQMERADVVRMMATDQLGMCVCAEDWWDSAVLEYGMDISNIGCSPLPAGPAGTYSLTGGNLMMFSKDTTDEQVEALFDWMEMIGNGPVLSDVAKENLVDQLEAKKADGRVIKVPSFDVWKDEARQADLAAIYEPYVNIDPVVQVPMMNDQVRMHPEYRVHSQDLYATMTECIQEVLTNENVDIMQLLTEKESDFQKDFLD